MARTTITPVMVATGAPLTEAAAAPTAADVANGNRFAWTGKELLLAENTGASGHTITFQSVAINGRQDPLHNTAINIDAGEKNLWNFTGQGWRQPSGDDLGYVQVSANHAEVVFTVIRMP